MNLTQKVFTQARLMAQELTEENQILLEAACRAAVVQLSAKLRDNLTPEDCQADFITAAGMYAVAAMSEVSDVGQFDHVKAGDLTLYKGAGNPAADCLRTQAAMLMAPYLKTGVAFLGV